jgi:hypothetical protein
MHFYKLHNGEYVNMDRVAVVKPLGNNVLTLYSDFGIVPLTVADPLDVENIKNIIKKYDVERALP